MRESTGEVVQDHYPEDFAHCYGCGRLNRDGYHVRTRMEGDEAVARFTPRPDHISVPGFVYGGLIASLVDCHAMGTAAAAVERAAGREVGEVAAPRFVTGSLRVDYLRPTPLGPEIVLRARTREIGARKVVVDVAVEVEGVQTARGEVVCVRMPDTMKSPGLRA